MFDRIKLRKLKELYNLAIENILEEEFRCAFNCLTEFESKSKGLLLILHSKKVDKSPLSLEDWNYLEFMATNASTLLSYLYTYMSNYYSKKCNEYEKSNIEIAANYAKDAEFAIQDSYHHKRFKILEPKLIEEISNNETTYIQQLNKLKALYEKTTSYEEQSKIRSRATDLHWKKERYLEEQKQQYQQACENDESQTDYKMEKMLEYYKELINRGNFCLPTEPGKSVEYYKNAYYYAKENDLEDEKDSACEHVVDGYIHWIQKKINSTGFQGSEMTKVQYYEEAIDLCNQALDWADSYDEEKILNLKSDAEYKMDVAYKEYYDIL